MRIVKTFSMGLAAVVSMASAAQASVTFTFDTDNQGWTTGDVSTAAPDPFTHASNWAGGQLTAQDEAAETGVYASSGVLGNQSAAYGNSISFDVSDTFNDDGPYPALVLYGVNGLAAAVSAGPPSTDNGALTHYSFDLTEGTFGQFTGGNSVGGSLTQAQFQSILDNLSGIAFRTEYKTGPDDSRFDNAIFNGFVDHAATGAVPEPAAWAMMLGGFGFLGGAMRNRRRRSLTVTFA